MEPGESELAMVRRHVEEGRRHLRSQHAVLAHLLELGADTRVAEELLAEFERTLEEHLNHLNRLLGLTE